MDTTPSVKKYRDLKLAIVALLFLGLVAYEYYSMSGFSPDDLQMGNRDPVASPDKALADNGRNANLQNLDTVDIQRDSNSEIPAAVSSAMAGAEAPGMERTNTTEADTDRGDSNAKTMAQPDQQVKSVTICKGEPPKGQDLGNRYIVASCESLSIISERIGVPVNDLIKRNPQVNNPDLIYPRQNLWIPSRG